MKVTALFVQNGGCYYGDPQIDPWDITRDARLYSGNDPVVAHPPCQLWGALAYVNFKRWGGEHNRPGNDQGCFRFALDTVNICGGVLEHPAKTQAFKTYGLSKPVFGVWSRCGKGWVTEVWQSAYGHRARKATWLYFKGIEKPFDLLWDRIAGTHQVGCECRQGSYNNNKPTLSKREANATPTRFRDILLQLARYSRDLMYDPSF